MKILYILSITLLAAAVQAMFSYQAEAEPVRCDQCTQEYPCVTVFEFKNVKFNHNVYCKLVEGREVWDSEDEEKFDMFYFESPNNADSRKKLKI